MGDPPVAAEFVRTLLSEIMEQVAPAEPTLQRLSRSNGPNRNVVPVTPERDLVTRLDPE